RSPGPKDTIPLRLGRRMRSCGVEFNLVRFHFQHGVRLDLVVLFFRTRRDYAAPRPATIPKLFVWFCSETGETRAPTLSASISVDQRLKNFRDLTLIPAPRSRRRGKLVCAPYVLLRRPVTVSTSASLA